MYFQQHQAIYRFKLLGDYLQLFPFTFSLNTGIIVKKKHLCYIYIKKKESFQHE